MKRHDIAAIAAALMLVSCSQQQETGFAIVIDQESYRQAQTEIDQYQKTVESRGLKPILVIDRWGVPDSIRQELIRLHADKTAPIEGCVFIGDIPVPMVRDAQHMASAFKMDQDGRFDRTEYCIPTDRFYDCFDLEWQYLDHDTLYTDYYYYSLRADGGQHLDPTIYSARITPRTNERGNKYEKLRRYMQRVNERAQQEPEVIDHILLFGGDGNLSNSIAARMDSKAEFYEQCPWLLDQQQSVKYMDYSQEKYIKTRVVNDIQNPQLDYALLSHHGDAAIQYLSGVTGDEHLLQTFEFDHVHPQATMVSLDACYNGSFHLDDNIQEAYLFGQGNGTMLVLANSVNAIQDKWVNRYMGLLGMGMRAGYMAKLGTFLEFHLFGDPTYTFAKSLDCGFDINEAINYKGDAFWIKQIDSNIPAIQSLAARMLTVTPANSDAIFNAFCRSTRSMTRMACLMELTRFRDRNMIECIKLGLNDENEMTQRFSVIYAGKNGSPELIEPLMRLRCQNNLSERVEFDLCSGAYHSLDSALVMDAFKKVFPECTFYWNQDSVREAYSSQIEADAGRLYFDIRKALKSTTASHASKLNAIRGIRNYPPHFLVDDILAYLDKPVAEEDAVIQKATWEAIGWFNLSYRAADIAEHARKVSEDDRFPASVRAEALKTYNRVK